MFFFVVATMLTPFAADADEHVFEENYELSSFYRGNTHTHTSMSDGDGDPVDVVRRYRDLGYNFLVLTDHSRADTANTVIGENRKNFLVLPGEEVTYSAPGERSEKGKTVSIHVNSICQDRNDGAPVPRRWLKSVRYALQQAIDFATTSPNALAQINHPNYQWALSYNDIAAVTGAALIEIANQHQTAHNAGDATHPSTEALWDQLLTNGKLLYGVASDDMHALNQGHGEKWARPERGWVQVAATDLTGTSIVAALKEGHFYASTGVTIQDIKIEGGTMRLEIAPGKATGASFVTYFIGKNGMLLSRQVGLHPKYQLKGDEGYVRARVYGAKQGMAWTQPVNVAK